MLRGFINLSFDIDMTYSLSVCFRLCYCLLSVSTLSKMRYCKLHGNFQNDISQFICYLGGRK